ncbi:unnamed protein product, partial [Allacma fusca]
AILTNPNSTPKDSWEKLGNARIVGRYKTLASARNAEEKSLFTSGIESDSSEEEQVSPKRRLRRKPNRLVEEESEGCDSENSEKEKGNHTFEQLKLVVPHVGLYSSIHG